MTEVGRREGDQILQATVEILADILACDPAEISLSDRLKEDLALDSDDFSFWLIPDLEERLGIEVPWEAWKEVATVGDVAHVARNTLTS